MSNYISRFVLLLSITLVGFTVAVGQGDDFKIKNTSKQIQSGLYECIVYLDITDELSGKIDDVTYTLPYGYPDRKHTVKRKKSTVNGSFSSKPIVTAEEIVINIKIEFTDDRDDVYLSYKLNPFSVSVK